MPIRAINNTDHESWIRFLESIFVIPAEEPFEVRSENTTLHAPMNYGPNSPLLHNSSVRGTSYIMIYHNWSLYERIY